LAQTVFIPREIDANEPRVAASPDTVKRIAALGFEVIIEAGAGASSRVPDADFANAGAAIGTAGDAGRADVVLKVRRPTGAELTGYRRGSIVIAIMDPYGNDAAISSLADAGVTAFAMEFMPRITRAQSMDVLSSQANLAGYQAVIDAAAEYDRALPMMMTAAGTVPAAKVFVMASVSPACRRSPPPGALAPSSPQPTFARPPRNRSHRSAQNSWRSRTRSSRRPRPPAATPRKCRRSTRPSRRR